MFMSFNTCVCFEEMGSAKYSRHRNQIEPILHAWLTELEQAKVDLMQSRTITGREYSLELW